MPEPNTVRSRVRCEVRKFLFGSLRSVFLAICITLALAGCPPPPTPPPPAPLGLDAKKFYGSTTPKSLFDPLFVPSCKPAEPQKKTDEHGTGHSSYQDDPTLHALTILADVNDHRFTGQMSEAFDDYFNRTFVEASLTTSGLTGKYPLALDGTASATIHVRDAHGRNKDVVIAPNGPFPNAAALALAFENLFKATTGVPDPWIKCQASGDEVVCKLDSLETQEGSFIRVKSGTNLATLGLNGPIEEPGNSAAVATLAGKPATYLVNAVAGNTVIIEIRDKDFRTRRYTVTFPAGNVANPTAVTAVMVPALNAEFNWAESYNAGANRIGLRGFCRGHQEKTPRFAWLAERRCQKSASTVPSEWMA